MCPLSFCSVLSIRNVTFICVCRCFALIESSTLEQTREETETEKMTHLESLVELGLSSTFSTILTQCSIEIFKVCASPTRQPLSQWSLFTFKLVSCFHCNYILTFEFLFVVFLNRWLLRKCITLPLPTSLRHVWQVEWWQTCAEQQLRYEFRHGYSSKKLVHTIAV